MGGNKIQLFLFFLDPELELKKTQYLVLILSDSPTASFPWSCDKEEWKEGLVLKMWVNMAVKWVKRIKILEPVRNVPTKVLATL